VIYHERNANTFNPDLLQGKTILIADDNEMNRLVVATILQSYGAIIREAADGAQAIDMVGKEQPELVLMNIQMPLLNGYDATKQIRQKGYTIPVIALTANAICGEKEKYREAGMNDYITKPFKEDAFLEIIAHWLQAEQVIKEKADLSPNITQQKDRSFDLTNLESISKGDKVFIHKMLRLFARQGPATVAEIKVAYELSDIEQVRKLAHRLKPSIDMLSIRAIQSEIRELESKVDNPENSPHIPDLIRHIESTIKSISDEITLYCNDA